MAPVIASAVIPTVIINIDVFWVLMLVSLAAIPLALMLRKVKPGGAAPMGH